MTTRPPWPVIVIASLYLLVGLGGFAVHFRELITGQPDAILVEAMETLAIVGGAGLALRQDWARWLALAWILAHVGISFFHPWRELLAHLAFCALIGWALFRPMTARWFRRHSAES